MKFVFIIFVFLLSKNLFAHENICKTPYQEEFLNDFKKLETSTPNWWASLYQSFCSLFTLTL